MPRRKSEVKVPQPKQMSSGKWYIYLRVKGQGISITEDTEAKCKAKAAAVKVGLIEAAEARKMPTLKEAIRAYIDERDKTVSPSTLAAYESILKKRLKGYLDKPIDKINYQKLINDERDAGKSAKTISNIWGLVSAAVRAQGITVPRVTLPQVVTKEHPFLDYEQILQFVQAVKGSRIEIPALLALHSLRASEIMALDWSQIDLKKKQIRVEGAAVYAEGHKLVKKAENKNRSSRRTVPLFIPELITALEAVPDKSGAVVPVSGMVIYKGINDICAAAGLPAVGVHGLRHSFCSLCHHLQIPERVCMKLGGWSDPKVMHKIYEHLSEKDINRDAAKLADFFNASQNVK